MKIASTMAGTVDDKGKYLKAVSKDRFPWKEFGFPELVGEDVDDDEEDDSEYLTDKPPPSWREEGDDPEMDYIFGEGNMKQAMKDNAKIGNMGLALSSTLAKKQG